MDRVSIRTAGIAGIIFVVLVAAPGFASGAPPDAGDPAAKFVAYYHDNRGALITANFLAGAGNFFALYYLAGLVVAFRRLGGAPLLIVAAFSGLLLTGAIASVGGIFNLMAAFRIGEAQHPDAETIRLLADGAAVSFAFIGFTLAVYLLASGLLMARAAYFPTWLSWLGFLTAALEVVGSFTVFNTTGGFSPEGIAGLFLGLVPFGVFTLATSAVLALRGKAIEAAGS